jgi:hypothetical protein
MDMHATLKEFLLYMGAFTKVGRCRLKPADTQVESALVSYTRESPYSPLFPHSGKWGSPPMHH